MSKMAARVVFQVGAYFRCSREIAERIVAEAMAESIARGVDEIPEEAFVRAAERLGYGRSND